MMMVRAEEVVKPNSCSRVVVPNAPNPGLWFCRPLNEHGATGPQFSRTVLYRDVSEVTPGTSSYILAELISLASINTF